MVKGILGQVVVIHTPNDETFSQAIFLLKNEADERVGLSEEELLDEARRMVRLYSAPRRAHIPRKYSGLVWAALGAAPVALGWLLSILLA